MLFCVFSSVFPEYHTHTPTQTWALTIAYSIFYKGMCSSFLCTVLKSCDTVSHSIPLHLSVPIGTCNPVNAERMAESENEVFEGGEKSSMEKCSKGLY